MVFDGNSIFQRGDYMKIPKGTKNDLILLYSYCIRWQIFYIQNIEM